MFTVVGIAGSLRTGSYNVALLRAAAEVSPPTLSVQIETIAGIGLYHADTEHREGVPSRVQALKDRVAHADGLLLVTPEYNASFPGTLKNALDWLSRPASDIERVFGGRPVAVMSASPGRGGGRRAVSAMWPVLDALGATSWTSGSLHVARASKVFDEHGAMVDEDLRVEVASFMARFAAFIQSGAGDAPS